MPNKRFATKDDLLAIASEASEKYLDAADYHRALTWGEAKDRYTWGTIKGASDTSGQTTTANLQLVKPGYGSSLDIASINANSDTLDTAIKAVQDATDALEDARANLNALLGTLGLNAQGQPLIDAASARSTLGAATDGNSGTTLYAAQQAIATNASAISTLQSSVVIQTLNVTTTANADVSPFGALTRRSVESSYGTPISYVTDVPSSNPTMVVFRGATSADYIDVYSATPATFTMYVLYYKKPD